MTGIAKGASLTTIGAVILPVTFTGLDERRKCQRIRFRIFAKGERNWMGFDIGGPSLEPQPVWLGFRSSTSGHYFQTLGITVRRCEA